MIKDYFAIGLKNIKKRKLRSWLTLFGIFLSIATIFMLISLSLGLQGAIEEQFRQLGSDKFFVFPSGQLGPPGSSAMAVELTEDDERVIEKTSGVKSTSSFNIGNAKIEFANQIRYSLIIGISSEAFDIFTEANFADLEEGSLFSKGERGKVVLGSRYKHDNIFKRPLRTGEKILLNGVEFKVKGVFESVGNPEDDSQIYISREDFKELFNSGDRVDQIIAQINPGEDIKEIAEKVEKDLRKSRNVKEETQDFTILTPEELLESFGDVLNIITSFLIGIASISLFVGSIGIANTMYTSVLERTREIGTMKAVGAKNSDILKIFVIESGLIGLMGGVIGVIIGIIIGKVIEFIAINQLGTTLLKPAMPAWLILGSLIFAFLIGAVSGALPALQASKLKPVDALRYE